MFHHVRATRWFAPFVTLLIVLAVFAAQGVRAQTGETPIAEGDTVKGTLTESQYQQLYALDAKAGDTLTITMTADDGALDPYLLLEDAGGKTLAKDDDSAGEHNARLIFTFEEDGKYTLVATRFGQLSGPTTGDYTLSVKAGTESATPSATQAATPAEPGVTPTFTPSPTASVAATTVAIEETATEEPSSTFAKQPTPIVAATTPATEEPTMEGLSNGEPPTEPPTATPTLRPTRTRQPTRTPTEIAQEETPTDEPTLEEPTSTRRPTRTPTRRPTRAAPTATPDIVVDGGSINDGDSLTGDIDDTRVLYLYSYEGTAGEQITLTMEAQGDLTPSVAIFPPTGDTAIKTVTAQEGESQVTLSVTLPDDGTYDIAASRAGGSTGTTSGSFTLTLSANSAPGEIDPAGDPPVVIARLRDAKLVPQGGKQLFVVPLNSFTRVSTPGLHFLPIGNNAAAQNFVLNFRVVWTTAGDQSACGMGFWQKSNAEVTFLLLTNDGRVILIQRQGQQFLVNYTADSSLFTPTEITTVTVIAVGDQISLYINGQFQTTQKGVGLRGKFELETFNAEGNTVVTNCRYPSGWVWSFDR